MAKLWYKSGRFMPFTNQPGVLPEANVGTDANGHIYYPNVSTCITITMVLADDSLVGVHLDKLSTTNDLGQITAKLNELRGSKAVSELVVAGVLKSLTSGGGGWMSDGNYKYPALLKTFSTAFGYTGPVATFVQDDNDERHYDVRAIGGGKSLFFTKKVRLNSKTGGSESLASTTGPWNNETLLRTQP